MDVDISDASPVQAMVLHECQHLGRLGHDGHRKVLEQLQYGARIGGAAACEEWSALDLTCARTGVCAGRMAQCAIGQLVGPNN